MSPSVVQVTVVALFALMCGVLAVAWFRKRLGLVALVVLVAAVAAWGLALVAIVTESGGASEFATCGDDCGAGQFVVAVAFIASPLLVALAALGLLVSRGSRWRQRRANGAGAG